MTFSAEIILLLVMAGFHSVILGVTLANLFSAPVLKNLKKKRGSDPLISKRGSDPLVSVLVPARNEAGTIQYCLSSVIYQDYQNFEVILLNDNSEDNTREIADSLAALHPRLTVRDGKPLPEGWLGKNWACSQLSEMARGEILMFIDADCFLSPTAVRAGVEFMEHYGIDLLSSFPTQRMKSFQELLITPLMNWLLLTFLPLRMVYLSKRVSLTAANGQFMVFRKEAYRAIGGHDAVKNRVVEDMEMARLIKTHGMGMMTALGGTAVMCRMYRSFREGFQGFSKNFYPGFNMSRAGFVFMVLFFLAMFLVPFLLIPVNTLFAIPAGAALAERICVSLKDRQNPLANALLHPAHMGIMAAVGFHSAISSGTGRLEWKGRKI